jgi:hypothetical protein
VEADTQQTTASVFDDAMAILSPDADKQFLADLDEEQLSAMAERWLEATVPELRVIGPGDQTLDGATLAFRAMVADTIRDACHSGAIKQHLARLCALQASATMLVVLRKQFPDIDPGALTAEQQYILEGGLADREFVRTMIRDVVEDDLWWAMLAELLALDRQERGATQREETRDVLDILERAARRLAEPPPATGEPKRRGRRAAIPVRLPQHTAQEIRTLTMALADGPFAPTLTTLVPRTRRDRGWEDVIGELALRHVVREQPLQVKFLPGRWLMECWPQAPSHETLYGELAMAGVPAVLLAHVTIGLALEQHEVTISLDDLMLLIGWKPRSSAERKDFRQRLWHLLMLLDSLLVIGTRERGVYRGADRQPLTNMTTQDAMISIVGRADAQLPIDGSVPPDEVTFVAGPWLNRFRENHQVLPHFGDVLRLAQLPDGQPSGAWARCIGLALQQFWREKAASSGLGHAGEDNTPTVRFSRLPTRRELLDMFPADPRFYYVTLLADGRPGRMLDYWNSAIMLLKQIDFIPQNYTEPKPSRRQGWADEWLDEAIDIRPAREGREAVIEIAQRAASARKARAKRRSPSGAS